MTPALGRPARGFCYPRAVAVVKVDIQHDGPARPGERVAATVIVESDGERSIDAVKLTLTGTARTWAADRVDVVQFVSVEEELVGFTTLRSGKRRLRASFTIPEDAPPTCDAGDLSVHYELSARVFIPWHVDPRAARALPVLPRPAPPRGEFHRVTASSAPTGDMLFLELSLDDDRWAPGETITGAFSIGNVGTMRLDGATVAVVRRFGSIARAVLGDATVFKSLVGAGEGSVIRFAIPLAKGTPPSFEGMIGSLSRAVVLRVDGSEIECALPITIDAFEPRADAQRDAGEAVGASRWRGTWREEGARRGLSLARHELVLEGDLPGRVSVKVEPHGNGLSAELRWPSFDVGLSVDKLGLFPLSGVDLYRTSPAFAGRFAAGGREEAQVRAVLDARMCAAIAAFTTAKVSDRSARVALDVPARSAEGLRRFLDAVAELSEAALAAARRVPPPSWVSAADAERWRAFAALAGGKLRCGAMRVRRAIVDAERVDVQTVLDERGRPEATRLVLALDPAVDPPEHADMPPALAAAARAAARDPGRAPALDVAPEAMTLTLGGFTPDPADLRPLVAHMARYAARLRGDGARGPYR